MNSGFFKHLLFWVVLIPAVAVLVLPVFFNIEHYQITDSEYSMHEKMIGEENHNEAIENAQSTYKRLITPVSEWMCSTKLDSDLNTKSVDHLVKQANKSRCQSILRGVYRINVEWSLFVGVLILCLAAFYDGAVERSIGKYEFGYNNPVAFHLVTHSIIGMLGITFIGVFLPINFSLTYYIAYCVLIVFASWMASRNFQTGA